MRLRPLTPRELQVAKQVGLGLSDAEIAEVLGIKWGTVRTHVTNILFKCKVHSRAALVAEVWWAGLLRLSREEAS
jgi:DNA-binding CsgD family transcriptional regulator